LRKNNIYIYIVLSLAIVPTIVKFLFFPSYPGSDDAFIHARIVSNITSGLGWGVNINEPVNMSTAPLYTCILSIIAIFTNDFFFPAMIFSCLLSAFSIIITYLIISSLTTSNIVRLLGTILAAFNIHLWRWNGTLMETIPAVALTLLIFYFCIRFSKNLTTKKIIWIGVVQGAAILVRPESILLLLSIILYLRLNTTRNLISIVVPLLFAVILTILPWIFFSLSYLHSLVPTTYYAKTTIFHWVNITVLKAVTIILATGYLPLLIFYILCLFFAPQLQSKERSFLIQKILPFFLFPLILITFYYFRTPGLMASARYFFPALSIIPIIGVLTLDKYFIYLKKNLIYWTCFLMCFIQIGLTAYFAGTVVVPVLTGFQSNYVETMSSVAKFLEFNCKPVDNVLVEADIGVISFYGNSKFKIADGGGLASPNLRGLNLKERISVSKALFVVQSLGTRSNEYAGEDNRLKFLFSKSFKSHGIAESKKIYYCNVYRVIH